MEKLLTLMILLVFISCINEQKKPKKLPVKEIIFSKEDLESLKEFERFRFENSCFWQVCHKRSNNKTRR